jgi:hypothetical protein
MHPFNSRTLSRCYSAQALPRRQKVGDAASTHHPAGVLMPRARWATGRSALRLQGPVDDQAWQTLLEGMPEQVATTTLELHDLRLDAVSRARLRALMARMPALKNLVLKNIEAHDDGTPWAPYELPGLESLHVECSKGGGHTLAPLLLAIQAQPGRVRVEGRGMAASDHQAMAGALTTYGGPRALQLVRISSFDALAMYMPLLQNNPRLSELSLYDCDFHDQGGAFLLALQQGCTNLTRLCLKQCTLADTTSLACLLPLAALGQLRELRLLANNGVNVSMALRLLQQLPRLPNLRRLSIDLGPCEGRNFSYSETTFRPPIYVIALQVLIQTGNLTHLDTFGIPATSGIPAHWSKVHEAMITNKRLLRFCIRPALADDHDREAIDGFVRRNRREWSRGAIAQGAMAGIWHSARRERSPLGMFEWAHASYIADVVSIQDNRSPIALSMVNTAAHQGAQEALRRWERSEEPPPMDESLEKALRKPK